MKRCVEYKGYQIEAEIYDVIGTGVIAMITPLTSLAAVVDASASVTDKDNMIPMKFDGAWLAQERDRFSIIDLGLRAAMIDIDVRLSRVDIPKTN
jgi:hypothetical protein